MTYQIHPTQNIPSEVFQLAAMHQLGAFRTFYKARVLPRGKVVSLLLIVLGPLIFIGNIGSTNDPLLLLLFCLGLLALGLYLPIRQMLMLSLTVYVYANGCIRVLSGKADVIRWNQVQSVLLAVQRNSVRYYWTTISANTTVRCTVYRTDGSKFVFSEILHNAKDLGHTIVRETTAYLLPQAIANYNTGNTLNFGKLSLNQQGLNNGQKALPWHQVKSVQINNGFISIKKKDTWLNWATVSVGKVPNFAVFMAMVNHITGIT